MATGRNQFDGSPASSSSSRGGFYATTRCNFGLDEVVRTVKKGPNIGSKFFGCPKWPDTECNFMKWVDCTNGDDLRFQIFERETTIAELEMQKSMLEDKVKRLQGKKGNFEEEVQEMKAEVSQLRIELMRSSRNEYNLTMALFCSWLFFGIVVLMFK
uniref:GRF-type domain-containing protein n=1 Tax=Chenopodium quinoa TaxID=63459 RepID=A0A803M6Z0_CHEQI